MAAKRDLAASGLLVPTAPFNAAHHVREILEVVAAYDGPRNLDALDVFSGESQVWIQMLEEGKACERFDILYGDDILTHGGFHKLLRQTLCLKQRSIAVCGPPCSLWVFLSSSFHMRSKENPAGDDTKDAVVAANTIVTNLCMILIVMAFRQAWFLISKKISQPPSC